VTYKNEIKAKLKVMFSYEFLEGMWDSGSIAPLILNLGCKWSLHPGKQPQCPINSKSDELNGRSGSFGKEERSHVPEGNLL
jgi:hypothetical protein